MFWEISQRVLPLQQTPLEMKGQRSSAIVAGAAKASHLPDPVGGSGGLILLGFLTRIIGTLIINVYIKTFELLIIIFVFRIYKVSITRSFGSRSRTGTAATVSGSYNYWFI